MRWEGENRSGGYHHLVLSGSALNEQIVPSALSPIQTPRWLVLSEATLIFLLLTLTLHLLHTSLSLVNVFPSAVPFKPLSLILNPSSTPENAHFQATQTLCVKRPLISRAKTVRRWHLHILLHSSIS